MQVFLAAHWVRDDNMTMCKFMAKKRVKMDTCVTVKVNGERALLKNARHEPVPSSMEEAE